MQNGRDRIFFNRTSIKKFVTAKRTILKSVDFPAIGDVKIHGPHFFVR
jgi:hypothetical protein